MLIKISSRKSDLARIQAYAVADALKKQFPNLQTQMNFKESLGDINLTDPLWKIPEKGVFTEDFNKDLADGSADVVVHSWKDLPTEIKKTSLIAATLPRADQRDLLIIKKSHLNIIENSQTLRLYSSSPRRAYTAETFLKNYFPYKLNTLSFESVRGNVPTRLKKLFDAESIDGMILAKAALDRLLSTQADEFKDVQKIIHEQLNQLNWMVLPLSVVPNAAAQGALALEIRSERTDLLALFKTINDQSTFDCVQAERQELAKHGGGCHQKIGITFWQHKHGLVKFLKGLTHSGVILDTAELVCTDHTIIQSRFTENELWSASLTEKSYFERCIEKPDMTKLPKQFSFFVSKKEAVNSIDEQILKKADVIWTAGLQTWKALAEKGIWVHGTSDQLGEADDLKLNFLKPVKSEWIKLTHSGSQKNTLTKNIIATYSLKRNTTPFEFKNKSCFFWGSASLFKAALQEHPEILSGIHCCGLGHTADEIHEILKSKLNTDPAGLTFFVFYNELQWRKTCLH